MKIEAVTFVIFKMDKSAKTTDFDLARDLKRHFDEKFHPTWQCIVGKNFGSEVGFEESHAIYFYFGAIVILLWKAG